MAPASFKSYEAQARLLRAIVAAHPEVKWNYKEIAVHYGSDMTEHALNHRFRVIRAHAEVVRGAVDQRVDCREIPADLPKDKKDIAKFFGESTADGIQFQFRGIKRDAESLKQTANNGGNPAVALNLGTGTSSAVSTPRKQRTATPSSRVRASGGGRSTAKKLKQVKPEPLSDEDEEDEEEIDYKALEDTPSKSRIRDRILDGRVTKNTGNTTNPRRSATPSRAATIAAAANIAQAAAIDLTTSDSEVNTPDNSAGYEPSALANTKSPAIAQQLQHPQPSFELPAIHIQPDVQVDIQLAAHSAAQPAAQPPPSVYSATSSFSQPLGNDAMWSNPGASNVEELVNFSFAGSNDFVESGFPSYDANSYMDSAEGEI
ncbi:hypothetical protein CCHL11_03993 [Colletotrichum chlorophyti]|uniref:Uncharacterized protein n=1 Tax=Colletotrichum chlorophyti TaxID=708187 RepID=A0A1Q8RL29_9PEZI|nr:hypothetical protein CCHL11_03993 [Colletotrichum chlorophyti]